jgi:hypothetical protein
MAGMNLRQFIERGGRIPRPGDRVRWYVETNEYKEGVVLRVYPHCFLFKTDKGTLYAPPISSIMMKDVQAAKYGPCKILENRDESK